MKTIDDLFPQPEKTIDDLFPAATSGAYADALAMHSAAGRRLSAFGQGFESVWGAGTGVSKDEEKELSQYGLFQDYDKQEHSFFKSVNEAFMRPAAVLGQTLFKGPLALAAGLAAYGRQAGVEAGFPKIGEAIGAIPEMLPALIGTGVRLPPVIESARDLKVIGRGESGWKGTEPRVDPPAPPAPEPPLGVEPTRVARPTQKQPNLKNINSGDDVTSYVREATPKQNPVRSGGALSEGETLDLADTLGAPTSEIDRSAVGNVFNSDELVEASRLFLESAEELPELMEKAKTGGVQDLVAYAEARERHLMLQEKLKGATERAIEGPKEIPAVGEEPATVEPPEEYVARLTGKTEAELRDEAEAGLAMETPQQTSKLLADSEKPGFAAKLVEYRTNNLISGPATHGEYVVGNHLFALMRAIPETAFGGVAGGVRRAFGGEAGVHPSEAIGQLYGFLTGHMDGLRAAAEAWRTKATVRLPGEAESPMFFPRQRAIQGPLGEAINTPGRAINAIHSYHRQVGYSQWKNGLAHREALNEGLEGPALHGRISELSQYPTETIMNEAVKESTNQVLMGKGGALMQLLTQAQSHSLLARALVPFLRISSNIARQTFLERTPLGLIDKEIRDNLFGRNGPAARDTQIGKLLWTGTLASTVIFMKESGTVTGDYSDDPKIRAVQTAEGFQPYSLNIGSTSYSYRRLGVPGLLIATIADFYDAGQALTKDQSRKAAGHIVAGISKGILNETWLRDIADLVNVAQDWDRYGPRYIGNLISSFTVPASVGVSQINRQIDPDLREARTILDVAKSQIPFASQTLHPRIGAWGEPIPTLQSLTPGLTAIYMDHYRNDPTNQTLLRLGVGPSPIPRSLRGVQLTDDQHEELARMAGKLAKVRLDQIIGMEGFDRISPEMQTRLLTRAIDKTRQTAEDLMLMNNEDLVNKAREAKLKKLGVQP